MKKAVKHEGDKSASAAFLRNLLLPASIAYGAGALARILAYAGGVIPRYKASIPVVSVGNLTVGGTGKTPVAIDLARRFVAAGYRPAVLSRGYKRKSQQSFVVVSDGKNILTACENAGDEPFLIALSVPDSAVIVGARRSETALIAIDQLDCNLIILDDGFQHLKVKRDVDIVLIDYNDDIAHDRLLPAGRLREPLASLTRASAVVITKLPREPDRLKLEKMSEIIHKLNPRASIGLLRFVPTEIVSFDATNQAFAGLVREHDLARLPREVIAFCGLARPERFYEELELHGARPLAKMSFQDHHWYTASDVTKLNELASKHQAKAFVTTEKDIVKFVYLRHQLQVPVFALGQATQWISNIPPSVEALLSSQVSAR